MSTAPVLGIDLGTTNSVVAVAEGTRVTVLADPEGNRLIPSVVSFHPQGDVLVGYSARERRLLDAKNTIYSTKRLLGRPWDSHEVRTAQGRFAFEMVEGPNKSVLVVARNETYTLPEISAFVLREVRRVAEQSLGVECSRAVITVPANFNELQRAATKAAGKVAGLEVMRILNEPTAAALAYGYGKGSRERIVIYDLGGGTFDVTILELAGEVFEVLATAGDTFLGGDDFDLAVAERMADTFLAQHRVDPRRDPQAFERLRAAAEWSKCQLSTDQDVSLRIEELAYGAGGASLDLTFAMDRATLNALTGRLVDRTFDVCSDALHIAKLAPTQIDNVILVGGSTRMPLVRERVAEYFGRAPLATIDPDLVVAQGAALQGYALRGERGSIIPEGKALARVALRKAPAPDPAAAQRRMEIREEIARERPEQPAFAPRPAPKRREEAQPAVVASPAMAVGVKSPSVPPSRGPISRPPPVPRTQRTLDMPGGARSAPPPLPSPPASSPPPSDPFALPGLPLPDASWGQPPASPWGAPAPDPFGAFGTQAPSAPQGYGPPAPMAPEVPEIPMAAAGPPPLLLDVTPQTLGVETVGGYCEPVIKRNAAIPVEQTRVFSTGVDDQEVVHVRIVQGESRASSENQPLGEILLDGLRPARRGQIRIGVTFVMDESGTLGVRAKDLETGRETGVRISLLGALPEDEIRRMQERQQRMV